jgi:hypothetical protein
MLAAWVACKDDSAAPPVDVREAVDLLPPEPVVDLALAYDPADDKARFTWTAPRDDFLRDRADHYDIRYGYAFPFDWEHSTPAPSPPVPLAAGTVQSYALAGPRRGRDLFAAIRAVDAAGNQSTVETVAHVRVPGYSLEATCLDVASRSPVPGLDALVASRFSTRVTTDVAGRISLTDLAEGAFGIVIETGAAPSPYHRMEDAFALDDDVALFYSMIPFQAAASPLYPSILGILHDAVIAPGPEKIVLNWRTHPVAWYAPAFVNSMGLDYRALVERAAARWNERVGLDLFSPVPDPPASGVVFHFLSRSQMGIQNGYTEYSNDAEGYPLLDRVRILDEFSDGEKLYRIMLHELGHTIRLGHLPAGFIMYGAQSLPADITDDEAAVVRLLVSLPGGISLAKYDPAPPVP